MARRKKKANILSNSCSGSFMEDLKSFFKMVKRLQVSLGVSPGLSSKVQIFSRRLFL